MSKLGPKCQYFVWPPLFSSTALTLLGMEFTRASRCHWSTLPLLHDDITKLVDVRNLVLFHLPFEDAPQITFTLRFLAKQWSTWRCVWGSYHVGILPCGPDCFRGFLVQHLYKRLPSGMTAMQTSLM